MEQIITPNPNIPCKPGWCLAYVNEAFGVPKRFGSATAAWNGSTTQHRDWDFPSGVWFPVYFSLAAEPNGHIALRSPDGSVYSTTDLSTTPRRHPNMTDLLRIYAGADMALTYLGWTEDVEGTPVIRPTGISLASSGTITPSEEDELSGTAETNITAAVNHAFQRLIEEMPELVWAYKNGVDRDAYQILRDIPGDAWKTPIDYRNPVTGDLVVDGTTPETVLSYLDTNVSRILEAATPQQIADSIPEAIVAKVAQLLTERLAA